MKKRNLLIIVLCLVLSVLTVLQSLKGTATSARFTHGTIEKMEGDWSEAVPQGDNMVKITFSYEVPGDISLPDAYLYMNSYGTSFDVFVDGEERFLHHGVQDGYAHLIKLGEANGGDQITLEFTVGAADNFLNLHRSDLYLGDQAGITSQILRENAYVFVFCLFSAMLFVVVLILAAMFRKILQPEMYEALLSLGMFILTAGIWVLTDSRLLLLATSNVPTVALISYLAFFSMPMFMLRFVRQMVDIGRRSYAVFMTLYLAILIVFSVNYLLNFFNSLLPAIAEQVMFVPTIVMVWLYGIRQLRRDADYKLKLVLMGYACYSIGCVVMLVTYYADPFSHYTRYYMLGIAGFIIFLFDTACRSIYEQMQRSVNLEVQAKLAYRDVMTDIGNRAAFREQQAVDRTYPGSIAYLMADINNLKITNDTLGHSVGDELIIRTANCLREALDGKGECYRIGGDEFLARLTDLDEAQAAKYVRRFYTLVEEENAKSELKLSVACGFVLAGTEPKDLDALLRDADAAMYREKQRIKSGA